MANKPLVLSDNYLDDVVLHPSHVITTSHDEVAGSEVYHLADNLRDVTSYTPATVADRPHLDFTANAEGGTDQRILTGIPGGFVHPGTSHTFAFLYRSTGTVTTPQTLFYADGANGLVKLQRCFPTFGNRLSFYMAGANHDYGVGANAPTDDEWHTLIFEFNGTTGRAFVYVDGVQVGDVAGATYAPQGISGSTGWGFMGRGGSFIEACEGRLGRIAYWSTAIGAGSVANAHANLMAEDRESGNPNAGATHLWDPLLGQGGQRVIDVRTGTVASPGNASPYIGRTASLEWNPPYDPMWAGGHHVRVDVGADAEEVAPDILIIDRDHNLWGQYLIVEGNSNGAANDATWYSDRVMAIARQVPALNADGTFTPGGDPSTGVCVTEEGALWIKAPGTQVAARYQRVRIFGGDSATFIPIIKGMYLGASYRFPEYLNGPAAYDFRISHKIRENKVSDGGVRIKRGILNFAEVNLACSLEDADFAAFHEQVKPLLLKNHPWWFCLDDSTGAGAALMRLFQIPGDTVYDPVVDPVHRRVAFLLEEVAPQITI